MAHEDAVNEEILVPSSVQEPWKSEKAQKWQMATKEEMRVVQ